MKTKAIIAISLALMAVLSISCISTIAAAPAEKATGTYGADPISNPNQPIYVEFNAHEAMGDRPAKGQYHQYRPDIDRDVFCDVKYVSVNPAENRAYVAALCWKDSQNGDLEGQWLYLIVEDVGTPGREGDLMWARWYSTEAQAMNAVATEVFSYYVAYAVFDGNLVVHT